ncbi:sugar transferase [Mucilaginibacter sabulilitoris]|uniref:Sugar transferase n=1 Tax=Mucilaginibacter sabulilitoris TaxID=1173583 RepID=A0ABZ0TU35_9SPHI|nr:sugar transferase [Mucilaginibacter sabulilitoris]WPU95299.1 sugar transferase [Mucilaginibacter sabulilitoris]
MIWKRIFDVCLALTGIILFAPLFIIIAVMIRVDSKGGVFYIQRRVGRFGVDFSLFKFRTMYTDSDRGGLLTIGFHDYRITPTGYWLRKYKLDELPQLFNILIGDMSFVGPRPEVRKYVELYTPYQQRVLTIKPGITDWASIHYFNENELLAHAEEPEKLYVSKIIPSKINYNLSYIDQHDLWTDVKIIYQTIKRVVKK